MSEKITIKAETIGTCEIEIERERFEEAIQAGRLDHELDAWVSDMDEETTLELPDGSILSYPDGERIGQVQPPVFVITDEIRAAYLDGWGASGCNIRAGLRAAALAAGFRVEER